MEIAWATWGCEVGGEGDLSPLSSLLGGVLKGDMRSSAETFPPSGTKEALATPLEEKDAGLVGSLGFPARFIGGGIPELEATDGLRPPRSRSGTTEGGFMGSEEGAGLLDACRNGTCRASIAGVVALLCTGKFLSPLPGGDPDCDAEAEVGCGETRKVGDETCESTSRVGDPGELTVTRGGVLVGDLGGELCGESWYMEIGRWLLLLVSTALVSGVRCGA